jgi:hypothetical protein
MTKTVTEKYIEKKADELKELSLKFGNIQKLHMKKFKLASGLLTI